MACTPLYLERPLTTSSWPGVTRPSLASHQLIEEIVPPGIVGKYQINLPRPWPVLQVLLPLYRRSDISMMLGVNNALQTVALGEAEGCPDSMFPSSAREVVGDADIEGTVRAVGYNVDPSSSHGFIVRTKSPDCKRGVDGRVKPGHDREEV